MFLEKRVYQGSSGSVYPLPFTDRISEERKDVAWDAIHLENEFLYVMILPQIGGRIHIGMDKTNGYDFFYRQNVIKPALVGLAGSWISGGVEINWAQHHRPTTFQPVEAEIEHHSDGSVTVWLGDHEPMSRMKGMHGVCLHPGRAMIELKARVYNRTSLRQTFLWWANVAARAHEQYQSLFPPDVTHVADHAKRATSGFPLCSEAYYGVDYGRRAKEGVPEEETPRCFVPSGSYAANDLSWYANIPVPTSYMAMGSTEDFFGGYDHAREAGFVHVASHHISPGKKQWTWGNQEFGYAWDRNLTDEDGPYVELMSGVYTDNQPDFSFLAPGETKTWSQYWYPIQKIGPAQKANIDAALSLHVEDGNARIGVSVTSRFDRSEVLLDCEGGTLFRQTCNLAPGEPFFGNVTLPKHACDVMLRVIAHDGRELISYQPKPQASREAPPPATEPPSPEDIVSSDELFLTGLHLDQYRHATRSPEPYWREALRRDPGDARCNNALGLRHLRRGEFQVAETHFRKAIDRLTRRNPNPIDGEPHYNLGLALCHLGQDEKAYAAFYKAIWSQAWQGAGYLALAEIDCRKNDWHSGLDHVERALRANTENLKARNLKALILRALGRVQEAETTLREILSLDALDGWARVQLGHGIGNDAQLYLDIALDYAQAGFIVEATDLLDKCHPQPGSGTGPLVEYYLGWLQTKLGEPARALEHYKAAAAALPDYCFPARLEEIAILESAMGANPKDPRAPYYLGNLVYDRRRHEEAIALWEKSSILDPDFSIVWRNLGIGYFNVKKLPKKAQAAYDKALRVNPADARLLYERDQLWKRLAVAPAKRLQELERHPDLVACRDDLSIEVCALHNQIGEHEKALAILSKRKFQPWEGGEGLVLGQHVRTHLALGRRFLKAGNATEAIAHFQQALDVPRNLGEARHLLANASDIWYCLGEASGGMGDMDAAKRWWKKAADFRGDFQEMTVCAFSEMTFFSVLALARLGRNGAARKLATGLLDHANMLAKTPAKIDYFATSLPTLLLFNEDLQERQKCSARFLAAQAEFTLGRKAQALKQAKKVLDFDPSHAAADFLTHIS